MRKLPYASGLDSARYRDLRQFFSSPGYQFGAILKNRERLSQCCLVRVGDCALYQRCPTTVSAERRHQKTICRVSDLWNRNGPLRVNEVRKIDGGVAYRFRVQRLN